MASLNELRRKIKGIKSTQQITKAMKMIAGARLARIQKRLADARYFSAKIEAAIREIPDLPAHPLLRGNDSRKICLIVITADKGLCGSFNNNTLRKSLEFMQRNSDKEIHVVAIGKKAQDYFRRQHVTVVNEYANIFNKLDFNSAQRIADECVRYHLQEGFSETFLLYNEIKSIIKQQVVESRILPIDMGTPQQNKEQYDFLYEPPKKDLLERLLPKYIAYRMYSVLLDSYTAELAARMTAMDNASKNAHDLITDITLIMNKVRQAGITRELAEIVGASEVLR